MATTGDHDLAVDKLVGRPSGFYYSDIIYAGLRALTKDASAFIIGGDWMESLLLDRKKGRTDSQEFFQRAASDGWVEATHEFFGSPEVELRTWYAKRNDRTTLPYQNDRIFLDKGLAARINDCDAIAYPAQFLHLSDHAPLVMELEP